MEDSACLILFTFIFSSLKYVLIFVFYSYTIQFETPVLILSALFILEALLVTVFEVIFSVSNNEGIVILTGSKMERSLLFLNAINLVNHIFNKVIVILVVYTFGNLYRILV